MCLWRLSQEGLLPGWGHLHVPGAMLSAGPPLAAVKSGGGAVGNRAEPVPRTLSSPPPRPGGKSRAKSGQIFQCMAPGTLITGFSQI